MAHQLHLHACSLLLALALLLMSVQGQGQLQMGSGPIRNSDEAVSPRLVGVLTAAAWAGAYLSRCCCGQAYAVPECLAAHLHIVCTCV